MIQDNDFNSIAGADVTAKFNGAFLDQVSGNPIGKRFADLGGGSLGSWGGNIFCNGSSDFIALDGTPTGQFHELIAQDNYWTNVIGAPTQTSDKYQDTAANIQRHDKTGDVDVTGFLNDGCS